MATSFSAPEYAALAMFGLTIISAVSGKSVVKGIIAGLIGMVLSFAGTDPIWGDLRFTFGNYNLLSGVATMPALIGLYSIPQILNGCTNKNTVRNVKVKMKNFMPSLKSLWKSKWNIIRTSIIGVFRAC
jgi:putative tricarboxylic transport membrane protein